MTDMEMLELAAKAAEYKLMPTGFIWDNNQAEMIEWNPLTDDGDALRLAVKLRIEPHFVSDDEVHAVVLQQSGIGEWETVLAEESTKKDIYASTRRAIVRAAAEIGKTL